MLNAEYNSDINLLRITASNTTVLKFTYCLQKNLISSESHEFSV